MKLLKGCTIMSLIEKFDKTKYSPYIHNITPNSSYIKIDSEQNKGIVHIHNVFDSVLALFVNISSREWPTAGSEEKDNFIFLNYCIKGRCEVSLDYGLTTCVNEGEVSISRSSAIKEFLYPLKQYEGIEILFEVDELSQFDRILKESFNIDIMKTLEYYTLSKLPFTSEMNLKSRQLMKELWEKRNDENLFEMKMLLLHLLNLLSEKGISADNKKRIYLTSAQKQIAKSVESMITKDLQKKITAAELAKMFSVSETTLKTYFKGLYGKNISTYLQEVRMNEAAKQIAETDNPISDIAAMVGYENQSKFAAVFKKYSDVSPIEYRRLKHCKIDNIDNE